MYCEVLRSGRIRFNIMKAIEMLFFKDFGDLGTL